MNRSTPEADPIKRVYGLFKDPFESKPHGDPLAETHNTFKEPLSILKVPYKDPVKLVVKVPEYRPYNSYHEYEVPDIDPLTEKPMHRRPEKTKKAKEPKKTKKPVPKLYVRFRLDSSVDSEKRALRIQENLNF